MKRATLVLFLSAALAACADADLDTGSNQSDLDTINGNGAPEPSAAGVQWIHGDASHKGGGGGSPQLVYHGGPVITAGTYVEAIYWGPSWGDASFVGDKQTGLASFYQGIGGSSYAGTNTEYTDTTGAHVNTAVSWGGSHVDLSTAVRSGSKTAPILAEACAQATNLVANGYYPVYIDNPRGHAGYCAWHSTGTCPNGTQIQIGFFFNLDGDRGCDPQDASGQHSQGLAALANVSGHEWSEMVTDQHLNAWYDGTGGENADKCAWSFGTPLLSFKNGTQWKIQGNWSNAAFDAGTGYANLSGQSGCLDGGNFK